MYIIVEEISMYVILTRGSRVSNVRKTPMQEVTVETDSIPAACRPKTSRLVMLWVTTGRHRSTAGESSTLLLPLQPMPRWSAGFVQALIIGHVSCKPCNSETTELVLILCFI